MLMLLVSRADGTEGADVAGIDGANGADFV